MLRFGEAPYLECSSKGDKRFSAFYARLQYFDNRSIEELYQAGKLFRIGTAYIDGLRRREAEELQKQPGVEIVNLDILRELYSDYWNIYIRERPNLVKVLRAANGLSDIFGQEGHVCQQAEELWRIRNDYESFPRSLYES